MKLEKQATYINTNTNTHKQINKQIVKSIASPAFVKTDVISLLSDLVTLPCLTFGKQAKSSVHTVPRRRQKKILSFPVSLPFQPRSLVSSSVASL